MELNDHLMRQIAFSRETFGPGTRKNGVLDHIGKEVSEVRNAETGEERAKEYVDIVLLALDGLWRELDAIATEKGESKNPVMLAAKASTMISRKQRLNEQRDWPDWRTQSPDQAIEHTRAE